MTFTRKALSRRTVLRGCGAAVALPFLDAMVPALSARAAQARPVRLGFFYVPNGATMANFHPKEAGTLTELPSTLASLQPLRDQVLVVTGLANLQAEDMGGGPHSRCHTVWLSGVRPRRTEGADIQAGTTIDQFAAAKIGTDTPLASLQLALEPSYLTGNCDNGYSCVYQNTFSWRAPTRPLPMDNNPRSVFERLFGDSSNADARAARLRRDRSILDSVADELKGLQQTLGTRDRSTVDGYLESVRDVERRIQNAEKSNISLEVPAQPMGIPETFDAHAKLMLDLVLLAYRADITRVVAFQYSQEQSLRTYPHIGVPNGHHDVSHHGNEPMKMALNGKINAYHVSLTARLAEQMRQIAEGDGTLLDHAILLHGGGMGDGDLHSPRDLPVAIVGGGGRQIKGGRHIKAKELTPMMNLGLSLLDKLDVELPSLGDSTGRLAEV
jgi:hypothetical protein